VVITSASKFQLSEPWLINEKILTNSPDLCSRLQPVPLSSVGYDEMKLPSPIPAEAGSNTSCLCARLPLYWLERLDEFISSLAVLQPQAWCFLPVLVPWC